jgi:hypothetical protein
VDGRGDYYIFDDTGEFRDREFGMGAPAVLGAAAYGVDANGNPTPAAIDMYMRRFGPFVTESGKSISRTTVDGAYLQSGTFFRLREASATYRIPDRWVQQYVRARSASLRLTMRNLHTWTDYLGLDPESDQFLAVPANKQWTVGFNITF